MMRKYVQYVVLMCAFLELRAQNLNQIPTSGYTVIDLLNDDFILRGDASTRGSHCYLVTENGRLKRGYAWWPDMLDLTQNFRMDFVISPGDVDTSGDGYAFIMQRDPDDLNATGTFGHALSVGGITGGPLGGIGPSLAVEIDTDQSPNLYNPINPCNSNIPGQTTYRDPAPDHLSLVVNGWNLCPDSIQTTDANNVLLPALVQDTPILPDFSNVEDINVCLRMTIIWDYLTLNRQRIRVFISDADGSNPKLRLMKLDDFVQRIFGNDTEVRWGFGGTTPSNGGREQAVCAISGFGDPLPVDDTWNVPANREPSLNVVSNDIINSPHFDLWVTRIVTPPTNGVATLRDDQKVIDYNPNDGYTGTDRLVYEVCDVEDNTRCYAKCAQGVVDINVVCPENRGVLLSKTNDDQGCGLSTGSIIASAIDTMDINEATYVEEFTNSQLNATSGNTFQTSDGQTTTWDIEVITAANGGEIAEVEETLGQGRYISIPPRGTYFLNINFYFPDAIAGGRLFWDLGVSEGWI